jgi:hypothetical protein
MIKRHRLTLRIDKASDRKRREALAEANEPSSKVIRQDLRLVFLWPEVTTAILEGNHPASLSLARIPKLLPLPWAGRALARLKGIGRSMSGSALAHDWPGRFRM